MKQGWTILAFVLLVIGFIAFKKVIQPRAESIPSTGRNPEEVIRFYQELGLFSGVDPATVLKRWASEYGGLPDPRKPWDDAQLLRYSEGDVWADDPEADVCAENKVYLEVLPEWARISRGAFAPTDISERWESEHGPIRLTFQLTGRAVSLSPKYRDDWIDLEVLRQINALITPSGPKFECAVDGNFAVVFCLTAEQKERMQTQRKFPFAW